MDEEEKIRYKKKLNGFRNNDLETLISSLSDKKITGTKEELVTFLIKDHFEDIIKFFDHYEKLRSISLYRAKRYLKNKDPDKTKLIDDLKNKRLLILFLYENKSLSEMDNLCFYSSIKSKEFRYSYALKTKKDLELEEISESIIKFRNKWNEFNYYKIDVVGSVDNGGKSLTITIKKEYGPQTIHYFRYRKYLKRSGADDPFSIETLKLYPLQSKRIEMTKTAKGEYTIIFDFNPDEDKTIMHYFTGTIFGRGSKLNKVEIKDVRELEDDIKTSLSKKPEMSEIQKLITGKSTSIIDKIKKDKTFTKEKKAELEKIAKSLRFAGPSFKNDPKTTARNVTLLVDDFGTMGKVIRSFPNFIRDILKNVPKSRENIVLYINKKPFLIKNGEICPLTRLSEDEETVIRLLSGVENE